MLCCKAEPHWAGLLLLAIALGPHAVTHLGVSRAKSVGSQCVLTLALSAYFAWFAYVYINVFYVHVSAFAAIAIAFVPLYAMPIMMVFWVLAYWIERKQEPGWERPPAPTKHTIIANR